MYVHIVHICIFTQISTHTYLYIHIYTQISEGLEPTVVTYGRLLGACAEPGREWQGALELLQEMAQSSIV